MGSYNTPIYTGRTSTTEDGINKQENSTRTGYYMKKRMRTDVTFVNANGSWEEKPNYTPRIRYTEIHLNDAEAANEANGPPGVTQNDANSADAVNRTIRAQD